MPKIPPISSEKMTKVLQKLGYVQIRQKGSHVILKKDKKLVVVPIHRGKPLKRGLVRLIIKEVGITREEFLKLLEEV
ncbi:MAG: hypothetical protein PWP76_59 [Candidatus Diapherotrites archaeon]|nr:hypothetical protein [Candidatus Diapherotrites archaeon]MDN5366962.1 hypothetical protein [Candidatus Diapherotrites archaeon]